MIWKSLLATQSKCAFSYFHRIITAFKSNSFEPQYLYTVCMKPLGLKCKRLEIQNKDLSSFKWTSHHSAFSMPEDSGSFLSYIQSRTLQLNEWILLLQLLGEAWYFSDVINLLVFKGDLFPLTGREVLNSIKISKELLRGWEMQSLLK